MNGRNLDKSDEIDGKTSRSICDAVGERLQHSLWPEPLGRSTQLQHLLDELRSRDYESRTGSPN